MESHHLPLTDLAVLPLQGANAEENTETLHFASALKAEIFFGTG
jgi:hypothetical protein